MILGQSTLHQFISIGLLWPWPANNFSTFFQFKQTGNGSRRSRLLHRFIELDWPSCLAQSTSLSLHSGWLVDLLRRADFGWEARIIVTSSLDSSGLVLGLCTATIFITSLNNNNLSLDSDMLALGRGTATRFITSFRSITNIDFFTSVFLQQFIQSGWPSGLGSAYFLQQFIQSGWPSGLGSTNFLQLNQSG